MTKEELVAVVERVHALWNQSGFTPRELKAIHEAWWDLLGELEFDTVMAAVKERALQEGHPPRPAEIRRLAVMSTVAYTAPVPAEAWGELRDAAQKLESGVGLDQPLHPLIRETVAKLGGSTALGFYTNRDRDLFMQEYASLLIKQVDPKLKSS